jgi:hypothetical protein
MSEPPSLRHMSRLALTRYRRMVALRATFDDLAEEEGYREARQMFRAAAGSQPDYQEMQRDIVACTSLVILIGYLRKGMSLKSAAEFLVEANEKSPGLYAARGGRTSVPAVEQRLKRLLRGEAPKTASPLLKDLMLEAAEALHRRRRR